jgi:predicted nucleic acid-binding protein
MIKKRKIGFVTPRIEAYETSIKIINLDSRIEETDALHYAIAVQEKANAFVTFDEKMVGNKTLEEGFNVKIVHPENL